MSAATTQIIIQGKDQASGVFESAAASISRHLQRIETDTVGASQQLAALGGAVGAAAAALAGFGAGSVAADFVRTAASFESLAISLQTVTGSSAAAKAAMSWITEFTATTPYQIGEVADAFRKLSAYGIDAAKTLPMLGDTASAMGKSLNDAVEMFADATTGEFERLKEFGVRAKTEGDKVTLAWT